MSGMKIVGKWMTHLIFILMLTVTFSFVAVQLADSRPFRIAKTPDKGRNFGCATCHISPRGGGEKSAFGRDYEFVALKAGDTYTNELGEMDSDGDGFSNDQEFAAGTNPGDPDSKPGK